jgi:hypothetical protein
MVALQAGNKNDACPSGLEAEKISILWWEDKDRCLAINEISSIFQHQGGVSAWESHYISGRRTKHIKF